MTVLGDTQQLTMQQCIANDPDHRELARGGDALTSHSKFV